MEGGLNSTLRYRSARDAVLGAVQVGDQVYAVVLLPSCAIFDLAISLSYRIRYGGIMATLRPDPTFYPSAKQAREAPPEELAYLAMLSPSLSRPDAIGVVDLKPGSKSYGRVVGKFDMPNTGDELHHFGWNACSASLCPWAPLPHIERRYLVVPGINSSRIHILDTKANPRKPELIKV